MARVLSWNDRVHAGRQSHLLSSAYCYNTLPYCPTKIQRPFFLVQPGRPASLSSCPRSYSTQLSGEHRPQACVRLMRSTLRCPRSNNQSIASNSQIDGVSRRDDEFVPLPDTRLMRQRIVLPDGKILTWDEYGRPNGIPIFFLHGYPSCGLEGASIHWHAWKMGLRFICPDRPGMGWSTGWGEGLSMKQNDFYPIREYPKHLAALAWHLSLADFAVIGGSGGGPYAIGCAHLLQREIEQFVQNGLGGLSTAHKKGRHLMALPYEPDGVCQAEYSQSSTSSEQGYEHAADRPESKQNLLFGTPAMPKLQAVGVLAGAQHPSHNMKGMSFTGKAIYKAIGLSDYLAQKSGIYWQQNSANRDLFMKQFEKALGRSKHPGERALLEDPSTLPTIAELFYHTFARQSQGHGAYVESRALTNKTGWGFEVRDVDFRGADGNGVRLWYGTDDVNTPASSGEAYHRHLRRSKYIPFKGETHFTLVEEHFQEILEEAVEAMSLPKHKIGPIGKPGKEYNWKVLELVKQKMSSYDGHVVPMSL